MIVLSVGAGVAALRGVSGDGAVRRPELPGKRTWQIEVRGAMVIRDDYSLRSQIGGPIRAR
ncbi:hypothetical protein F4556_000511 [Kitasatospora gansuensis]|uniref:Uncharacterized protein n=1 Tax=Kitasatospora gansuensis TaxID=258050 RepID=A0A7W7S6T8_9ACTN|nr:hypothetical protein [Kitasatospora gansuensis]